MKVYVEMEVYLYSFLTMAESRTSGQVHGPVDLPVRNIRLCVLNTKLDWASDGLCALEKR